MIDIKSLAKEIEGTVRMLNSETRLEILSYLYKEGSMYMADLSKRLGMEPNKLSYHLQMMNDKLIKQELTREGRKLSKYSIMEKGVHFLDILGLKHELDRI